MNILLIVNELKYSCGVTNHILHLSSGLAAQGNVNLWIICGGGNGINRFSEMNVTIISDERFLHLNRSFSGFISGINFLVKFIRQNNIDIIHSHSHYGAAIAKRASKLTGKTTVQTNHGILPDMGRLKHFNADKYIAINEHIRQHILNDKIANEENIFFIRCGIPVDGKLNIKESNGKIKVAAASRFVYGKGLDIYIKAVNMLPEEILNKADFYLAGEGELEDELNELNRSHGSKINFPGRIIDMYSFLSKTHVLVNPSRSDSEGFPAIITEAGATNTLVISSDFKGAEGVLKDIVNSLIFTEYKPENLSDILKKVISNYKSYTHLTSSFYEFIKKEFSVPVMIDKHISLYNKCLVK
jgi:glycosyltransferase involved in cell wall biosynthesis